MRKHLTYETAEKLFVDSGLTISEIAGRSIQTESVLWDWCAIGNWQTKRQSMVTSYLECLVLNFDALRRLKSKQRLGYDPDNGILRPEQYDSLIAPIEEEINNLVSKLRFGTYFPTLLSSVIVGELDA